MNSARLNARAFTYALMILWAILYVGCALLIVLAPRIAMLFYSYLIHVNLTSLSPTLTPGNFLIGLLAGAVLAAVSGIIFVWLYNRFADKDA